MSKYNILCEDNLAVLRRIPSMQFQLIYIDPPFNTGKTQKRISLKTQRDEQGDRTGFQGERYATEVVGESSYEDDFEDYLAFLRPRLEEAKRLLTPTGSMLVHLDYREVHYVKVLLDKIFGRSSFINEIIWAYDYGARSKTRWPAKHDNILWYANNPESYCFNLEESDRLPYMAPELVGPEKAARGKTPTDVWWNTIVGTNSKEKTGYPTQKPLGILNRLVAVHASPGDYCMDFFAGSGSFGEAAFRRGCNVLLVDNNPVATSLMEKRLAAVAADCAEKRKVTA